MLQQTRVAAVIPYYERFLKRFPRVEDLAQASETELLSLWAGLGYYSRARNLQKAARQIVEAGGFPRDYESIRELAGVGDYTAAAVASIAFGLPHAAIDGNVRRVVMRLAGDAACRCRSDSDSIIGHARSRALESGHDGARRDSVPAARPPVCCMPYIGRMPSPSPRHPKGVAAAEEESHGSARAHATGHPPKRPHPAHAQPPRLRILGASRNLLRRSPRARS